MHTHTLWQLPRPRLDEILDALRADGHRVIGPQVRDGAIVLADLDSAAELPRGLRDAQMPGQYRLTKTDDARCFAWATTAQGLKPWLFAPEETLWQVTRNEAGRLDFTSRRPEAAPLAVLGARACDLAGLQLLDAHFLASKHADPYYAARRAGLFLIAVDCTHPADTCFCASTGDGPDARTGYDLALAELDDGYLVRAGSGAGAALLEPMRLEPATEAQRAQAEAASRQAVAQQHRALPSRNLAKPLFARLDHPHWQEVAERCLACGNCTAVCPTCFCHRETEHPALDGSGSEHQREWDSCFSAGHSHIYGLTVRAETRLRYRQWLTHKLAGWHAQFGRSGCVGCGRCIAWCPVGIDITAATSALCQS